MHHILTVAILIFAQAEQPPLGWCLPCKIMDVHDGDTLTVDAAGLVWNVRLLDCWSAELNQSGGIDARDFLRGRVDKAETVALFVPWPKNGRTALMFTFGRVLGRVYLDGEDVSAMMVRQNHATKTRKR